MEKGHHSYHSAQSYLPWKSEMFYMLFGILARVQNDLTTPKKKQKIIGLLKEKSINKETKH